MDHLTRAALAALVSIALVAGCSSDGGDGDATDTSEPIDITTTTRPVETGGIEVPELPGTFPVALPSLGFGIAVPQGWQATVLSDEALARLDDAALATPFFLEAARNVATTGAIFYAAGVDDQGRVAELKIDVQAGADTTPEAVAALAQAVIDGGAVRDGEAVDDDPADELLRVDFRVEQPSVDDGELIDAFGSQFFVVDGDRLWSLIVTSEDEATQTALLAVVESSLVFAE